MTTHFTWTRTNTTSASRHDDLYFFDLNNGWSISSNGDVIKTTNGGQTWEKKYYVSPCPPLNLHLRSIAWSNQAIGWVGAISWAEDIHEIGDYQNHLLYKTIDGGESWQKVPLPKAVAPGVCGLLALKDNQTVYVVGTNEPNNNQITGPTIAKTINGGKTWQVWSLSDLAINLIDIRQNQKGDIYVVGGRKKRIPSQEDTGFYQQFPQFKDLEPVVLKFHSADGGGWQDILPEHRSRPNLSEWGWKIQFLEGQLHQYGFISLQSLDGAAILTTEDGGENWTRHRVQNAQGERINNSIQAIGFIDQNQGWVGSWDWSDYIGGANSFTADGGEVWQAQDHIADDPDSDERVNINRYVFVDDRGFCSGQYVYRLMVEGDTPIDKSLRPPEKTDRISSINTDHNGDIQINYELSQAASSLFIGIWDSFGFHVKDLSSQVSLKQGAHRVSWDGSKYNGERAASGVYLAKITINNTHSDSCNVTLK